MDTIYLTGFQTTIPAVAAALGVPTTDVTITSNGAGTLSKITAPVRAGTLSANKASFISALTIEITQAQYTAAGGPE